VSEIEQMHVEWCRTFFSTLADGGTWAVPRSGLVFQKRDRSLVLVARMPHHPGMLKLPQPITEDDLTVYQDDDYAVICEHFEAAGISVTAAPREET
jgi:hypothetical protein